MSASNQEDCFSEPAILLANRPPWEYDETEQSLSEEKLKAILQKYMTELDISENPKYVAVEYYS